MSLSSKLEMAVAEVEANLCKFAVLITKLPAKDKETLLKILMVPESDPYRVPSAQIAAVLQEEGYNISHSSIMRHRRGVCSCNTGANN